MIVILIGAVIVFNTMAGAVISGYDMANCLMVNLSLCITAGLFYWLYSTWVSNALKIGLTFLLVGAGLVRAILMVFPTSEGQMLAFVGIILVELVAIAIARYTSSR